MKPSQNVETRHVRLIWITSTCEIDPSRTFTTLLSSFFSRGSSCEESINSGGSCVFAKDCMGVCTQGFLFHRQKRPTKTKSWKPEENVKKFCTPYETTIPKYCMAAHWNALLKSDKTEQITCIFFTNLVQTLVSLRTYKSAQMVEVLLLNRVLRSIVSDSKGLTAGKWVLSRGSLHSSSCWGMNFLSFHSCTRSMRSWEELWCRFLSPVKSWLWSGQKCFVV